MKLLEAKRYVSCIYKLTFPNGKSYVGQTKNLADRVRLYESKQYKDWSTDKGCVDEAISEFGIDNVELDILSEVSISDKQDLLIALSVLEIKYIKELGTLVPNGYNTSVGGEILGLSASAYSVLSGVDVSTTMGCKSVLQYDLDGNLVAEYDSIAHCAYALGVPDKDVSDNLNSRRRLFRNDCMLMFKRYGEVPQKILPFEPKTIEKTKVVTNVEYQDVVRYREKVKVLPNNPILKYNLDGEYCGTYESSIDAAMSIGRNTITKGGIHRGYLFLEHDGGDIEQNIGRIGKREIRCPKYTEFLVSHKQELERIESIKSSGVGNVYDFEDDRSHEWETLINDFLVGQYRLNGELVAIHEGIRGASRNTGVNYSNIWANVMGKTKKSNGYRWRKCDENGVPIEASVERRERKENSQDTLF